MAADWRLLTRFWSYMRAHRRWLWLALILMPLGVLCQLAAPLIIKYAIDEHLLTGATSRLGWDVLALLAVLLGEYGARTVERFGLIRCGILTLRDLRHALMDHLLVQPVGMYERRPLGAIVSRVTSDVEALMETLSTGVVTIVSDVLVLIGIVAVMAWLNLQLTLVTLATAVPVALIVNWYRQRLRTDYDRVRRHTGRMHGILNEAIVGAREMQLFNYERAMQQRFAAANHDYFRANMRIVAFDATLYSFVEGVGILTIAVMAWYGIQLVLAKTITIGVLIAFLTYIQRFYTPLKEFASKLAVLQGGFAAMNRVVELLDRDERHPWGTAVPHATKPSVEFDRVWFVYPQRRPSWPSEVSGPMGSRPQRKPSGLSGVPRPVGAGPQRKSSGVRGPQAVVPGALTEESANPEGPLTLPEVPVVPEQGQEPDGVYALRGLSFSVSPGERLAIVGWTGGGKSTVVKLLAGLYPPVRGRVLVDGQPVSGYAQTALQRHVGVVHQDVYLFADTIAFNVGLGLPTISREQIEAACRIAQADGFIRTLPQGYDTILAAGGRNLSQGQRQLLAIARILAWSPALVVLDEATASVDSHSESLIRQAILEVLRRKTTIVIAHRLATIQHVDRILVLHEGQAVETGTHAQLLRRRGLYYDLVQTQLVSSTP